MSDVEGAHKPTKTKIGAGVVGVGGGTFLVNYALGLPDGLWWKPWLLYAAPALTALSGALLAVLVYQCRTSLMQWTIQGALQQARRAVGACLKNPNTSDDHKAQMRKKLENIEALDVNNKIQRAQSLIGSEDFESNRGLPVAP